PRFIGRDSGPHQLVGREVEMAGELPVDAVALHSVLSAWSGSIRVARCPGMTLASKATRTITAAPPANVTASCGVIPNTSVVSSRLSAPAAMRRSEEHT